MLVKRSLMDNWGSVMTAHRCSAMTDIVSRIESEGISVKNRQVGNIINDLDRRAFYGLIRDLKSNIEEYNASVKRDNEELEEVDSLKHKITKWSTTAQKKTFLKVEIYNGLRDYLNQHGENALDAMHAIEAAWQDWK